MLDTNICIYAAQGEDAGLLTRLETFFAGDLVISAITLAELEAGTRRDPDRRVQRQQALADLVRYIRPVAFDARAAACFGELQAVVADLRRNAFDRLIAAHAISVGVPLVTNNARDFHDVPGLKIEMGVGISIGAQAPDQRSSPEAEADGTRRRCPLALDMRKPQHEIRCAHTARGSRSMQPVQYGVLWGGVMPTRVK